MKALFYVPPPQYNRRNMPIDRLYGCNYGYDYKPPMHLLQLATFMRDKSRWDVRFLDCPAEGIDAKGFERIAGDGGFDVSVSWSTYLSAEEDLRAARVLRRGNPRIQNVYTATAPTWRPAEFVRDNQSWALLGEPEHTLMELAQVWEGTRQQEQVDGLGWWDQGQKRSGFRQLLNVPDLPIPDRRLLLGTYRANRLDRYPVTAAVFSRGCGFRCTFCTPNAVDQTIELEFKRLQPVYKDRPPLRKRTVDQVVAEMEEIHALGYRAVEIADNVLTWGKTRTTEICDRIAPLGLQWIGLARANMLHDVEMVRAMARAGCTMVYMGSESFDDGLLSDMAKDLKVKDVVKAVQVCREAGVEPEVSVLMGASPNETWRTLFHSWRAARQLGTRFVHFSVALPSPSTELYDQAIENGWFVDGDFVPADNSKDVIVNLPHLSAFELRAALKFAYATQYLSPRGLRQQAGHVGSLVDLRHKARSAVKLFRFLGERDQARNGAIPPGRVTAS
ncbi:MAG: radical SAM protein [Myxococcales bacterium]|nr:radical SAM protein [Myxococcales bacterium]